MITVAFTLAALVLAVVAVVQSKGQGVLAWAVVLLAAGILLPRL
jgi:uncharacterized membrane protein YgdD (TMEM256/DUF423 family)